MWSFVLLSLSLTFLRLIHVVACVIILFLFITKWYSIAWIHTILLIHSSIDRNLGCLKFLAIMNNVAMCIRVQVFVWIYVFIFLGWNCWSYSSFTVNIFRNCQAVFQSGCTTYFISPTAVCEGSNFFTSFSCNSICSFPLCSLNIFRTLSRWNAQHESRIPVVQCTERRPRSSKIWSFHHSLDKSLTFFVPLHLLTCVKYAK